MVYVFSSSCVISCFETVTQHIERTPATLQYVNGGIGNSCKTIRTCVGRLLLVVSLVAENREIVEGETKPKLPLCAFGPLWARPLWAGPYICIYIYIYV